MDHLLGKGSIDVPRTVRLGVFAVCTALLLFSCEQPSYTTIEWLPDGDGFVQYSTNDPRKYNTIQYDPRPEEYELSMTTVTANVKKVSGPSVIGFGIVFCYQDENNHYLLMITTEGGYTMAKRVDGMYSSLFSENWYASGFLNPGVDMINNISITHDGSGHFDVMFNGHDITHFDDVDNFRGGDAGPCIGIGSYSDEEFPYIAEDARFQMTLPVIYP